MSTTPPQGPQGGPRLKTRDDDARGAPVGRFGNPGFTPTDAQRQRARTLGQAVAEHSERYIAADLGISLSTLRRHFEDDILAARAEMIASAGAQMISKALRGDDAVNAEGKLIAPGNLDALKFLLARRAGWSTKVEFGGRGGGPIESVDLSTFSPEQLREYGRLAAISAGLDPDEIVGPAGD